MHDGIIIAGTQSSSGKTLLNALLLCALSERGIALQPFKAGPDYIDTAYSAHFAGKPAYNLDFWLMGKDGIRATAQRHTSTARGVVEGVMGLIDGVSPYTSEGSTLHLAQLLGWPVLLVVPAAKQGRSLRATINGFLAEADGQVAGIILNQVSGASHADYLRRALHDLAVPIVGAVPKLPQFAWPERHLGLQARQEFQLHERPAFAAAAEAHLDVDAILQLFRPGSVADATPWAESVEPFGEGRRLAIAQDEAFHFYYEENLTALKGWGFELMPFSPLHDARLPGGVDGVILGGGFPEVYAEALEANRSMREALATEIQQGLPCYAECGGFMYLTEGIVQQGGESHAMTGVVPGRVHMGDRLKNFGYSWCHRPEDGASFRAHEFHYSDWDAAETHANLWTVSKPSRQTERTEGYGLPHLHASYLHLYFPTAALLFRRLFGRKEACV